MLVGELGMPSPIAIALAGVANCGENVLMYCTTSVMSLSARMRCQPGRAVPYKPCCTDPIRSSSDGTLPVSVVRILYLPLVKSRGCGVRYAADGPSPLPD